MFFADLKRKTISLWTHIHSSLDQYLNPLFPSFTHGPELVLRPIASVRAMRLWKGLYCRWNPGLCAPQHGCQRTKELLSKQDQLFKHVNELRLKLTNRSNNMQTTTRLASPMH